MTILVYNWVISIYYAVLGSNKVAKGPEMGTDQPSVQYTVIQCKT